MKLVTATKICFNKLFLLKLKYQGWNPKRYYAPAQDNHLFGAVSIQICQSARRYIKLEQVDVQLV